MESYYGFWWCVGKQLEIDPWVSFPHLPHFPRFPLVFAMWDKIVASLSYHKINCYQTSIEFVDDVECGEGNILCPVV